MWPLIFRPIKKRIFFFCFWSKYQRPHLTPLHLNIEKYQLLIHYQKKKKKSYYCGKPKLPQKSKKAPLKVHLTFSGRCYCSGSSPPLLRCCYRSIAVVTKSTAIDLPFNGGFGLLWQAENRRHMRLPLGSSDHLATGYARCYR